MNKICLLLISIATISCTMAQKSVFSKEALSEKLIASDNSEILFHDILNRYKGKTIVVEVWASWCSDCVKAMPKIKELQANNPDVIYIFISMDKTFDKWQEGISKHQLSGNHFWVADKEGMKGAFGKAINLDWIPRYIIINKKGEIVKYRAIETDFEEMKLTLQSLKLKNEN